MPHFTASHLGLFCLPMSHKKDARLIWVNAHLRFHQLNLYLMKMGNPSQNFQVVRSVRKFNPPDYEFPSEQKIVFQYSIMLNSLLVLLKAVKIDNSGISFNISP